jgi:hypothetical protein
MRVQLLAGPERAQPEYIYAMWGFSFSDDPWLGWRPPTPRRGTGAGAELHRMDLS